MRHLRKLIGLPAVHKSLTSWLSPKLIALLVALIGCVLASLPLSTAHAIESFGVGAVPANPRPGNPRTESIFIYQLEPSASTTDAVKVVNNSKTKKTLKVYPVDSAPSSDGAFACAQEVDERKSVGSWIQLAKDQVTLDPGTSETVGFTLKVPAKVSVGEHNGCIVVHDTTSRAEDGQNGIVLTFRSALRVAVTIPGDIRTQLEFMNVETRSIDDSRLQISPVLRNGGNVSLDTRLRVSLFDVFGRRLTSARGEYPVLVGTTSKFNFEFQKPFWGGWYRHMSDAGYTPLPQHARSTTSEKLDSHTRWVFVTPKPVALALEVSLILIAVIMVVLWVWMRRRRRKLQQGARRYTVAEGDDIQKVADAHKMNWKLLAKLNKLEEPYTLKPGDRLMIPRKYTQKGTGSGRSSRSGHRRRTMRSRKG